MTTTWSSGEALALVVPCYNEALRLDGDAFIRALDRYPWLSLCFVDDGSTDDTRAMLEQLASRRPGRAEVLVLPHNSGKAEAVRRGLLHVSPRTAICGFWDADLAAPLEELPGMHGVLLRSGIDWVWGIRLRSLGRRVERRATRHYLGRGFATVASFTVGVDAYDTQCGAKLFRVNAILASVLARPFVTRWIFDLELLVRANELRSVHEGGWIVELPLNAWQHKAGSKVLPFDFLRAIMDLARLYQQYILPRRAPAAEATAEEAVTHHRR